MIKFYQNNWHGIKFSSFGKNNLKNIADINFYNKFYNKFFLKFKYFDDLSNDWLNYKSEVAKIIQKQFGDKNNILSIGCGIGIVEKYIVENNQNINLTVIEPSKNACKWIENFRNIDINKRCKSLYCITPYLTDLSQIKTPNLIINAKPVAPMNAQ